jgi:succinate-semialdehyde dehydrogenase/glutarate-semialdehyde dehydrogenase
VAPLIRFTDEAEVIRLANDTDAGLAAYAYTRDLARAWRLAGQLDYGMVGINAALISTAEAAFGGMKQSGLGREGGRSGIDDYLETKYLSFGGLDD